MLLLFGEFDEGQGVWSTLIDIQENIYLPLLVI